MGCRSFALGPSRNSGGWRRHPWLLRDGLQRSCSLLRCQLCLQIRKLRYDPGLAVACCAQHLTEMSLLRGMHDLSARTGSIHIGYALSGVHSCDLWDSREARSSPPSTSHSSAHMLEKFQHQWLQHGPWISLVSMQHFPEKIAAAHGANFPCPSVGTQAPPLVWLLHHAAGTDFTLCDWAHHPQGRNLGLNACEESRRQDPLGTSHRKP